MFDNVTQFPKGPVPDLLIGPFQEYHIVVDWRVIPRLTGYDEGDKITLVLDGRFSHVFSKDDARSAAWLIANAVRYWGAREKWWPAWAELKTLLDDRVKRRLSLKQCLREELRHAV